MNSEWKRKPLPEDELAEADHAVRVSMFAAFREDLSAIIKDHSNGHSARTAASHLLPYTKHRSELLEWERRYPGLVARILTPLGRPFEKALLPYGWRRFVNSLRRLIAKDAGIAIRSNIKHTQKLLRKIEREAPTVERLLTVLGITQDSELRPAACLTDYIPPTDVDETSVDLQSAASKKKVVASPGPPLNLANLPVRIKYEGKIYHRNSAAKFAAECDQATEPQREAAVLRWGYEMPKVVIGRYIGIERASVEDRLDGYTRNAKKSHLAEKLRKSQAKRGMDAEGQWT